MAQHLSLFDILTPAGLNATKILKKLARHYFHDADLLYEIFVNNDLYLKETVMATC